MSIVNLLSSNFDTILLSVESDLSLISGWQFVGQVEWLSPTNFLHICWKQAKFNFHPDNFVRQLPSCDLFGNALCSDNHIFSTIWSLGALSGVRLQANGRVISLKRVSRLWSWLLLRVLSTCYFLVYLHWFQFWTPGGATCIALDCLIGNISWF